MRCVLAAYAACDPAIGCAAAELLLLLLLSCGGLLAAWAACGPTTGTAYFSCP